MASVSDRHAGGRPRTREPSELYVRVESLAKQKGLRLDELAKRAGIAVATLYQLSDPKVSTAKAIATALGITVDRLLSPPKRPTRRTA